MRSPETTFFIVRHGETVENSTGVSQGHRFGTLSDKGREQARATGAYLERLGINVIVASDLSRARESAEIMNRYIKKSVVTSALLRERALGDFEGLPAERYREWLRGCSASTVDVVPPGGESIRQLGIRAERSWLEILRPILERREGPLLVVAHGLLNRCLLTVLRREPLENSDTILQDNCCINEGWLESSGQVVFERINCSRHLQVSQNSPLITDG